MDNKIKIDIKDWLESHFDVKEAPFPDVRFDCPMCSDSKGRLYIAYEDKGKTKKGDCYCHNEQKAYSFFELYAMIENLTDGEAADQLFDRNPDPLYGTLEDFHKRLNEIQIDAPDVVTEITVTWPEGYVQLFGLTPEKWEERCPKYMKDRKITQVMCNEYFLGYCISGKYSRRMIVPIYFQGKLVAFQGRAMYPCNAYKYLFNEGIKIGEYIFNYDNVPAESDFVILVEGVFDAWGVKRAGFNEVGATFGKHLTETGIQTIMRRFRKVLIFWDMDALPEIKSLADSLEGFVEVYVTFLKGKDPDEATTAEVAEAIMNMKPYNEEFKMETLKYRCHK
jgi:5S rRNA maturation endonuclease (ribonuclease M5)